ncbi:endo-alpha-1,5-arabinanase precursor [Aspergillus heteromorphus CBS 117.55]|uniref:Arabinan endo-1,5-alpha-L-arabinosidase n=1 Tax=Aspergillus heteromorphus CBS 117.55 TaxID=1448321 RepID=A0A317W8D0_9EURO|nr:endo-alpha-1,5-arabinanase precursor [Aspergillus heteromorphus CBS 117.55]PWY82165.1 endo-alpha-1,5-arabinanase precursor [Aspergillus heteromorphus CBS 117.55]
MLQALHALLALPALAYAYASPESCSGECVVSDPGLIRRESDGKYFRFSTGNEISYASSDSLSGPWDVIGSVLPDGSSIDLDGNTDLWAPDVHYIDDTYYVFYAVSTFGSQDSAIGLATSTTMELDSWTDHGSIGVESESGKLYNSIDPNLIKVGSDYYMNFGSFYDDIYQVPMNSAATKKSSGDSAYNIAYNATTDHSEEGSYMYEYDDYYYLFFSSGACCDYNVDLPSPGEEYKIMVCRSKSATGDFVDKDGTACAESGGTPVLESHGTTYGPGGQGIFDDPTEGVIIYYHYINTDIGYADDDKQFGWNKLTWTDGWPSV